LTIGLRKWPVATAFGAAVLIHLSAVAIAFHRDSPAREPVGAIDFVPFGFEPADDPPVRLIPTCLFHCRRHRRASISLNLR
jgi:hypothetical protein